MGGTVVIKRNIFYMFTPKNVFACMFTYHDFFQFKANMLRKFHICLHRHRQLRTDKQKCK